MIPISSELILHLRKSLISTGELPVPVGFFDCHQSQVLYKQSFIKECIDDLDRRMLCAQVLGEKIGPIEALVIELLLSSTHISAPKIAV